MLPVRKTQLLQPVNQSGIFQVASLCIIFGCNLKKHQVSSRSHPRTFRVLTASFPRTCRAAHGHGRCGAKLSRSRHIEPRDTTMQRTLRSRVAPCDVLFFFWKHHNLDIRFIFIIFINYYLLLLHYYYHYIMLKHNPFLNGSRVGTCFLIDTAPPLRRLHAIHKRRLDTLIE